MNFKVGDRVVYKDTFFAEIFNIDADWTTAKYYYSLILEGSNQVVQGVPSEEIRYPVSTAYQSEAPKKEPIKHGWVHFDTPPKIKVKKD